MPSSRRSNLRPIHVAPVVPLLLVTILATSPIRDNSFLWHIRAGSLQRDMTRVLSEDPFSIDFVGQAWRTQSWLFELMYAQLESWTEGLGWASVMVAVLGCMTAGMIGISIYRAVRSPIITGFAMVITVWLAGPFLQPRPVIASYLLLAALVLVCQNRERVIWLVVPIMWIWAATHGSWVIGGGLVVLEWLRTRDRNVLKAGLVALGTVFLTAHGAGVWQVLVDFAGARGALNLIDEWFAPDFAEIMQAPYLILVAGIIVAALRGRIEPRDLIVILPFLFFGMTSRRAIFPATIVLAPWAALALPTLKLPRSSTSPAIAGLAVGVISLVALSMFFVRPLGLLNYERFPSPAIQQGMSGRSVFHDEVVGGYLIYDEWPDRLTLIDDRAELYGEDFFRRYLAAREGLYEEFFEEYEFDAALTKEKWGLTQRLDRDGWIRTVEENEMVLFYRPSG